MKPIPPSQHNYTFYFDPLEQNRSRVKFIDHDSRETKTCGFSIDDQELGIRNRTEFQPIIADLIDLAAAIYAADRLAAQDLQKFQRSLSIHLPLRSPAPFQTQSFQDQLTSLLAWGTGSKWNFNFQRRYIPERPVTEQLSIPVIKGDEVALWSGGLDALAGLYIRLKTEPQKSFILFGTGSNDNVYHQQFKVYKEIDSLFPGRIVLYRLPIRFHKSNHLNKNKAARTRGIVFILLGAACAYLMGRKELFLYENGIGAINLNYCKSSVGLDQSRSVHPITLNMVGRLISEIISEDFKIHNPFVFWTKSEMCQALNQDNKEALVALTSSCDSRHRKQISQCGYCSSCILRKQALMAADLQDNTKYVVPHDETPSGDTQIYFRAMKLQSQNPENQLNSASNNHLAKWENLSQLYPELDDMVDFLTKNEHLNQIEMRTRLIELYQKYVSEWSKAEHRILLSLSGKQTSNTSIATI